MAVAGVVGHPGVPGAVSQTHSPCDTAVMQIMGEWCQIEWPLWPQFVHRPGGLATRQPPGVTWRGEGVKGFRELFYHNCNPLWLNRVNEKSVFCILETTFLKQGLLRAREMLAPRKILVWKLPSPSKQESLIQCWTTVYDAGPTLDPWLVFAAQSWQYRDRRKPELRTMPYSYQMTSRFLYSAQNHRQYRTLNAYDQFGALYMHNINYKYPTRPGFEPSTFEFRATTGSNEPWGPAVCWGGKSELVKCSLSEKSSFGHSTRLANTGHWSNVGTIMDHLLQRLSNVNPALDEWLVFAGEE